MTQTSDWDLLLQPEPLPLAAGRAYSTANVISGEEIVEELAIEKVEAYVRTRQQSDEVLDGKHAHTNVDYEVCDEMHTGLADIAVNHLLGAPRFRLKSPHAASDVRKR
jgi:hypothetical protein